MEDVTRSVLAEEILKRLDLENLCSVACVSTTLRSAVVSGVLPSLTSLDLSVFSPDEVTLNHVMRGCIGLRSLTLNCLRLNSSAVHGVLGPHLLELHLLRCSLLNSTVLTSIGSLCPNLRVLTLEMADMDSPVVFQSNLTKMLEGCPYLESLQLNIRGILVDATACQSVRFSLPQTLKALRLQPLLESEAILLMNRFKVTANHLSLADYSSLLSPSSPSFTLQSLSLVLDLISDRLIIAITGSLPQLVKLDLEDRPEKEPFPDNDLTYTGLQSLGYCQQLTSLSLVRTCYNRKISFKRINDMGIFLLSEACKGLESVKLGGFPKVSDAGFASLLHSCRNLKKFEVRGAFLLSDLAFHDVTGSSCSLQEVRLSTCPLITSEAVKKLGLCGNLELLDLGSCKSISDSCLSSVSALRKLTSLNLAGADVTDSGMLALGKSDVPITQLSLRGCRRISDRGISNLLNSEGTISRTLSTLDLGHMPGISDRAVHTITRYCKVLTELSLRSCFHVKDSSIESLATRERQAEGGSSKQLRKLNVHNCVSLTTGALRWLSKPSFAGLHWLGLGQTRFAGRKETVTDTICRERPWLTLCFDGCELGCYDGWEFHTPQCH
uniref:F-box protein At-B n=1 Tax=Noccaea caerulescens TaxID=107243 RepID=A0A1J3GDI9_NOCCA